MASKTSRKMIAALQVSLDGFTQGPDRGEADWVDSWADAIQLIPDGARSICVQADSTESGRVILTYRT